MAFPMMACDGLNALSLRLDELPQNVADPCPSARSLLDYGGDIAAAERMILSMGTALDECAAEKDVAVDAYEKTRTILNGSGPE